MLHLCRSLPATCAVASRPFSLALVLSAVACGDDTSTPPPPPDITSPDVEIVFPTSHEEYDADGDGLADIQVRFLSEDVDPNTAVLTRVGGVNGPAPADANLLEFWTVEQWDANGILVHETIENLLYSGTNQLDFLVADTAGNESRTSLTFSVPAGSLHMTIESGVPVIKNPPVGLVSGMDVCDDGLLYVAINKTVVVIDADLLTVLARSTGIFPAELYGVLCVPGDPYVYVTGPRIRRFDRTTWEWAGEVPGTFSTQGLTQSAAQPNLLYAGESGLQAPIGLIDRSTGRIRSLDLPFDEDMEFVFDVTVLPGDEKLYVTRYFEGGVTVIDPLAEAVLDTLDFSPNSPGFGLAGDLALSPDGTRLYVAVSLGDPGGVWEINTTNDGVQRLLDLHIDRPATVAMSPNGERLFVANQEKEFASTPWAKSVLFDLQSWRILTSFDRPRPTGEYRWDQAAVFRPDGRLVFAANDNNIDVYINRE